MPTIVMFHFRLALLFGSLIAAVTPSSASDAAQQLEKTACFIFAGHENCRTVRVFDAEECIIKIYPEPLPNIDPTELACLRDEAQTKKLHLLRALPQNLTISDRIYVSGTNVIEVLVGFDGRGAALWQSRPADTFEILGDPIQTRNAVRRLATK
ncbi:MAG: hypothetical protein ACR2PG_05510, partial [Hyphomicrobiaceae bacterium]